MSTIDRILKLIENKSISDYAFEKQLGFTQGTISNWRRGKNKPSAEALSKVADFFGVSVDFLLCRTDEPAPIWTAADRAQGVQDELLMMLDDSEKTLIANYRAMAPEYQRMLLCISHKFIDGED